jgi:hypothetical protein
LKGIAALETTNEHQSTRMSLPNFLTLNDLRALNPYHSNVRPESPEWRDAQSA